jgi:hypothetical protein
LLELQSVFGFQPFTTPTTGQPSSLDETGLQTDKGIVLATA